MVPFCLFCGVFIALHPVYMYRPRQLHHTNKLMQGLYPIRQILIISPSIRASYADTAC
jgi:hypothetical protein